MIVSLRGTNGVGKSTLVREVLKSYSTQTILDPLDGRRRPRGYKCHLAGHAPLYVVGHYEIRNGGVDTLPSLDVAYDLAAGWSREGADVIMEGKNMSDGAAHALRLYECGLPLTVVHLHEELSTCEAGVRSRGHAIKRSTVERLIAKTTRDCELLEAHGVRVLWCSRHTALGELRGLLHL